MELHRPHQEALIASPGGTGWGRAAAVGKEDGSASWLVLTAHRSHSRTLAEEQEESRVLPALQSLPACSEQDGSVGRRAGRHPESLALLQRVTVQWAREGRRGGDHVVEPQTGIAPSAGSSLLPPPGGPGRQPLLCHGQPGSAPAGPPCQQPPGLAEWRWSGGGAAKPLQGLAPPGGDAREQHGRRPKRLHWLRFSIGFSNCAAPSI